MRTTCTGVEIVKFPLKIVSFDEPEKFFDTNEGVPSSFVGATGLRRTVSNDGRP